MRLLYICSDFGIPPNGTKGPSIHLRAITRALADHGHTLRLLSPKDGPGEGHPLRRLLPKSRTAAHEAAKTLKTWLDRRELDNTAAKELRPLMYNACIHDKALEALRAEPVDAIVERLALFGHVGVDLADALDLPLIVEVNALLTDESRRFRSLQLAGLAETIERRVLQRADAILAVSNQLAEQLVAHGVAADKIHVVPNGADIEHFDAAPPRDVCRAALDIEASFVVGFVGSLKSWHGADVLIKAFAKLRSEDRDARLLIVGKGPEEHNLRRAADTAGIEDAVIFTGAVSHDLIPRYIRAMDVAVAPYRPIDGFYFSPIKLFEYMAAGTPLVASRIGQIEEVIQDGVHGLLRSPADVDELHGALRRLRRSPELREGLAKRAGELVRERYTWAHTAATTSAVIEQAEGEAAEEPTEKPRTLKLHPQEPFAEAAS